MAFQQQSILTTIHVPITNLFAWKFSLAYLYIPDIHACQFLVSHNFKWSYFQTPQANQCCVANIHFCPAMKAVHILFDFVSTSLTLKHAEGQELGWYVEDGKDPLGSHSACQHQRCWMPCYNKIILMIKKHWMQNNFKYQLPAQPAFLLTSQS